MLSKISIVLHNTFPSIQEKEIQENENTLTGKFETFPCAEDKVVFLFSI